MTDITDAEIRANRLKWIEWLETPGHKQARGYLMDGEGAGCCLGHACAALGIEATKQGDNKVAFGEELAWCTMPEKGIDMLGLHTRGGESKFGETIMETRFTNLTEVNDMQVRTLPQIGAYLRTVIDGGDATPFRKISP